MNKLQFWIFKSPPETKNIRKKRWRPRFFGDFPSFFSEYFGVTLEAKEISKIQNYSF